MFQPRTIGLGYSVLLLAPIACANAVEAEDSLADFQKALDLAPPDDPDRTHIHAAIDSAQH